MIILVALLAGALQAAAAGSDSAANTHVDGRVTRNLSGSFDVYEPWLRVNQWVSTWSGGASISGSPLSGQVTRNGDSLRFFGPGLDADVHEFGGHFRVNATLSRPGQRPAYLSFTLQASGPLNDPSRPPMFSLWDAGANLRMNPSAGGRDYDLSGWVDPQRFGAEGVALVGIIAAMSVEKRLAPEPDAKPQTPEQRVFRVLPFPGLPLRP